MLKRAARENGRVVKRHLGSMKQKKATKRVEGDVEEGFTCNFPSEYRTCIRTDNIYLFGSISFKHESRRVIARVEILLLTVLMHPLGIHR